MKNKITLVRTHLRFGKGEINGLIFLIHCYSFNDDIEIKINSYLIEIPSHI